MTEFTIFARKYMAKIFIVYENKKLEKNMAKKPNKKIRPGYIRPKKVSFSVRSHDFRQFNTPKIYDPLYRFVCSFLLIYKEKTY